MKKILVSIIAVLALSFFTSAMAQGPQGKMTPEARSKKQTEQMKTDLGLTEDQVVKVGEINLKFHKKVQEARKEVIDRTQMREKMKPVRDEHIAELKKVLTEEQLKKFTSLMEERRKNGGKNGQRRRAQ